MNVFSREVITLRFMNFNTESNYDYLSLYDGIDQSAPLLAILSGSAPLGLSYASSQPYLYVKFTSDSSNQYNGFNATYTSSDKARKSLLRFDNGTRKYEAVIQTGQEYDFSSFVFQLV